MTHVLVVSSVRNVPKEKTAALVGFSLLMFIVAGVTLGYAVNTQCYDGHCDFKTALIISGIGCVLSAVVSLIGALSLHVKIKKEERQLQPPATRPRSPATRPRPPVTVAASSSQPVAAYLAMQTQYPPPYPPPGPTAYMKDLPGAQYQAPIEFNVAQQPTQGVTHRDSPPPYVP